MPDKRIMVESRVLMDMAQDLGVASQGSKSDSSLQLYSEDFYKAAQQRLVIEQFSKYQQSLFAFFYSKGTNQTKI